MKQQNNIKGKVTLADFSLGSILIPALWGISVEVWRLGILSKKMICLENNCGHIFIVPGSICACFRLCKCFVIVCMSLLNMISPAQLPRPNFLNQKSTICSPEEGPHQSSARLAPLSQTSSLQNCKKKLQSFISHP